MVPEACVKYRVSRFMLLVWQQNVYLDRTQDYKPTVPMAIHQVHTRVRIDEWLEFTKKSSPKNNPHFCKDAISILTRSRSLAHCWHGKDSHDVHITKAFMFTHSNKAEKSWDKGLWIVFYANFWMPFLNYNFVASLNANVMPL